MISMWTSGNHILCRRLCTLPVSPSADIPQPCSLCSLSQVFGSSCRLHPRHPAATSRRAPAAAHHTSAPHATSSPGFMLYFWRYSHRQCCRVPWRVLGSLLFLGVRRGTLQGISLGRSSNGMHVDFRGRSSMLVSADSWAQIFIPYLRGGVF